MELYSTAHQAPKISFQEALFRGLPPDNGLYLPTQLTKLPDAFYSSLGERSFQEIALEVSSHLLSDEIPEQDLVSIVESAFDFDVPTYRLGPMTYFLELFHGPTFAFKDFGARFMSRMMSHFLAKKQKEITILVATSGDTGGAVGSGFLGVPGINVVILYPGGKISGVQESQLTTLGDNVTALRVDGTFDDCQSLVKQAFLDPDLREMNLSSANSINISRLIPQSFYYFKAVSDLIRDGIDDPVTFSVPSGNLGNLCGGVLAAKLGLPVRAFVSATNANDTFPRYLETSSYQPKSSVMTLSNAMDVGAPSNFARLSEWFTHDEMKSIIKGYSFSDQDTVEMIREVYFSKNYTMCPHTAVAYAGWKQFKKTSEGPGVILSTAHPAKFSEAIHQSIEREPELPMALRAVTEQDKSFVKMPNDFASFKDFLSR